MCDLVKKCQVVFNEAVQCRMLDEVYDLIPRTHLKGNPVALAGFKVFPGMGKLDWGQRGQLVCETNSWLQFLRFAATKLDARPLRVIQTNGPLGWSVVSCARHNLERSSP